jgi:hypothetical protein
MNGQLVTYSKIFLHIVNTRWMCSLIHIQARSSLYANTPPGGPPPLAMLLPPQPPKKKTLKKSTTKTKTKNALLILI